MEWRAGYALLTFCPFGEMHVSPRFIQFTDSPTSLSLEADGIVLLINDIKLSSNHGIASLSVYTDSLSLRSIVSPSEIISEIAVRLAQQSIRGLVRKHFSH